jgi:hypothetical protein
LPYKRKESRHSFIESERERWDYLNQKEKPERGETKKAKKSLNFIPEISIQSM